MIKIEKEEANRTFQYTLVLSDLQCETEKAKSGRGIIVAPTSFKLIPIRFYLVRHSYSRVKNAMLPILPANRFVR